MGNFTSTVIFNSFMTQPFPCSQCGEIFQRPIEGSLLCADCRKNFEFEKLSSVEKTEYLSHYTIYPMYTFLAKKTPMITLTSDLKSGFSDDLAESIKPLSVKLSVRSKYKIIKSILKHFDQSDYFNQSDFKGIYIHSMKSNDILFIYHPQIKDKERICYLDIDKILSNAIPPS